METPLWSQDGHWSSDLEQGLRSGPRLTGLLLLPPPALVGLWPRYTGPGGRVGTRLKQERQWLSSQLCSLGFTPSDNPLPLSGGSTNGLQTSNTVSSQSYSKSASIPISKLIPD